MCFELSLGASFNAYNPEIPVEAESKVDVPGGAKGETRAVPIREDLIVKADVDFPGPVDEDQAKSTPG
jgi:hypothetical protein